jgi:hypothetical protein
VQSKPPPQPQGNYDGQSLIDPDEGGTGGNYDDFKKGGQVKAKPTSKVKSSKASSRGDGIAQRGKTRGTMR